MLNWFAKRAPIRVKFRVAATVQALLGLIPIGIAGAAAAGMIHTSPAVDVTLSGLTVATMCAITLYAGRLICRPYVETVVRMEALAAGDLSSPIDHTDNTDCVGRMTRAMAIFRRNTEEANTAGAQRAMAAALAEGLAALAQGDLAFRITADFPAEFESLRADFNAAMEAMMAAVSAVNLAAASIDSGSGDILRASDDLSQRTEQQAASLEETAAAMQQITVTVRDTAARAERASAVVGSARGEAEESGGIVARAVTAMGGIERASHEISDIISVIDGIAFQTNLLALNAGVEAARAGDAGRGFAVVASEVRALAQRSAEAAKDVKTRITASSEQVGAGVALVSATGTALQQIIARFGEISGLVTQIATAAEQQATALQQVNTAVGEMDNVTQQNAAMVEEATAAARNLASEANELVGQMARFRAEPRVAPVRRPVAVGNPVHHLQQRAAVEGRRLAQHARRSATAAVAVAGDDWSEF
ncbi:MULTISPECIES: methyl-accepting chemotaxis protein [Sphingomonas]|uniref:Methyl-accepting chemotaxis protein n=1 Tax=Sphingomonas kyungheensis TaxID=1069987 RepID=A0ABU8H5N4_9SPHN|nr:methyl-accepting chemotaxis protein [Sphingomonas sp. RIT328]EZP48643.1 Methyl-accepting chemotaxis (MCP) signaling domain protein [Sphingomonas sp. RIT328]